MWHERKAFWSSLNNRVVQVLACWDLPYHLTHNYTSEYNHVYHLEPTHESEHGPGVTTPLMKHSLSSQITSHLDVSLMDNPIPSERYFANLELPIDILVNYYSCNFTTKPTVVNCWISLDLTIRPGPRPSFAVFANHQQQGAGFIGWSLFAGCHIWDMCFFRQSKRCTS